MNNEQILFFAPCSLFFVLCSEQIGGVEVDGPAGWHDVGQF